MKIHNVKQGSEEWLALRKDYRTASEAQAMMGASKYMTRDHLIEQIMTGVVAEIDAQTQARFNEGHRVEALARTLVAALIGEELYPITASSDRYQFLLASFDGVTMTEDVIFEHKLWNESLAAEIKRGNLPKQYYWQVEQQLLVSGAEKCIFVVSDGTTNKFESMEYYPVEGRVDELLSGWVQFQSDCAVWKPSEPAVEVMGASLDSLPAIKVDVEGSIAVSSNLSLFEAQSKKLIDSISTELKTDQDFADAESAIKFCGKSEKEIVIVKDQVLAKVTDIDAVMRSLDSIKESIRSKRLMLDKLVKAQKLVVRSDIYSEARDKINDHIAALDKGFTRFRMPDIGDNINEKMKGKKTITSLRSAANDEVARVKIEANKIADLITKNLGYFDENAGEYDFLFRDLETIALKESEYFELVVSSRISDHEAAIKAKKEADDKAAQERIEKEEAAELARTAQQSETNDEVSPEVVKDAGEAPVSADEGKQGIVYDAATPTLGELVFNWAMRNKISKSATDELLEIIERVG